MSLTVDIYTDTQNDGFKNMNMHRKKIFFKKCVLPEKYPCLHLVFG